MLMGPGSRVVGIKATPKCNPLRYLLYKFYDYHLSRLNINQTSIQPSVDYKH